MQLMRLNIGKTSSPWIVNLSWHELVEFPLFSWGMSGRKWENFRGNFPGKKCLDTCRGCLEDPG